MMEMENWIILGVITLANIGLAWVSKSYAEIAREACKACISQSPIEERGTRDEVEAAGSESQHDT